MIRAHLRHQAHCPEWGCTPSTPPSESISTWHHICNPSNKKFISVIRAHSRPLLFDYETLGLWDYERFSHRPIFSLSHCLIIAVLRAKTRAQLPTSTYHYPQLPTARNSYSHRPTVPPSHSPNPQKKEWGSGVFTDCPSPKLVRLMRNGVDGKLVCP